MRGVEEEENGGSGPPEVRAIWVINGSDEVQRRRLGHHLRGPYCRKADVVLRGYSGWNTKMALEVLDQVFPKDAAVQPSLVIVYFRGNDATNPHPSGLGAHVPLPEYVDNMRKIIVHLKVHSSPFFAQ